MSHHLSRLLASTSVQDVIGTINAPVTIGDAGDPVGGIGKLLGFAIQAVFLVAGLAALMFMLLGAFNWIISEGQKEKIEKAQRMMMNAVIGLVLVVVVFTVFSFFMGTVLGGKFGIGGDFTIKVPQLGN